MSNSDIDGSSHWSSWVVEALTSLNYYVTLGEMTTTVNVSHLIKIYTIYDWILTLIYLESDLI